MKTNVIFFLFLIVLGLHRAKSSCTNCTANDTIVMKNTFADNAEYNYECGSNSTEFWLNQSLVSNFGFHYDKLSFVYENLTEVSESGCVFNNSDKNSTHHVRLYDRFGQCASNISIFLKYYYRVNYIICLYPHFDSVISRYKVIYFYFSCVYHFKIHKTVEIEPKVTPHKFIKPGNPRNIKKVLQIYRYTNSTFNKLDASTCAIDGTQIYLKTCIRSALNRQIDLQGLECKITNTSDPNAERQITIIKDGCPLADPLPFGRRQIYENFMTSCFSFSFTSFHWSYPPAIADQSLHIHCVVNVCDRNNNAGCVAKPTCPQSARRRRSIDSSNQNQVVISHGPIKIERKEKKKNLCNKKVLGCEYDCGLTSFGEEKCFCPVGTILGSNQKSCHVIEEAEEWFLTENLVYAISDGVSYIFILLSLTLLFDNIFFRKARS